MKIITAIFVLLIITNNLFAEIKMDNIKKINNCVYEIKYPITTTIIDFKNISYSTIQDLGSNYNLNIEGKFNLVLNKKLKDFFYEKLKSCKE